MNVHEKLLELRIRSGLSQQKMAETVGVAQTSISGWEKNIQPRPVALRNISKVFNVPVAVLLDNEKELPTESEPVVALVTEVKRLKAIALELVQIAEKLEGMK